MEPHQPNPYRLTWESGKTEVEKYREECAANRAASAALEAELAATVAARRSNRTALHGPLMARRISDGAEQRAAMAGHIDHTPGGSPGTWHVRVENPENCCDVTYKPTPTAPPPAVKRWVSDYKPRVKRARPGEALPWTEAFNRCQAAARIELAGRDSDDVDDAVQAIVMALEANVPGGFHAADVPPEWVTMTRLRHLAANHWRKRERERARLAGEEQQQQQDDAFGDGPDDIVRAEPIGTSEASHRAARAILADLGLPRLGRCYVLAYAAHRTRTLDALLPRNSRGGNGAADIIAAELGMSPGSYRKARMAAVKAAREGFPNVPASPEACLARLGIEPWRKPSAPVSLPANFAASVEKVRAHDATRQAAREREGTRILPGDRTPNATSIVPTSKPTVRTISPRASRAKVAGKPTSMKRTPPTWATGISPQARRYWQTRTDWKRTRAAAQTPTERIAARLAVGLPV